MAEIMKRDRDREPRSVDVFERFDRLFDDWARMLPFRRPGVVGRPSLGDDAIRVEERRDKDAIVVRAEIPGVDPEHDIELTVADGTLHLEAERREEKEEKDKAGYTRRELRYGTFSRSLPLPAGVTEADVSATYKDGILEVRIPAPEHRPTQRVEIKKLS